MVAERHLANTVRTTRAGPTTALASDRLRPGGPVPEKHSRVGIRMTTSFCARLIDGDDWHSHP